MTAGEGTADKASPTSHAVRVSAAVASHVRPNNPSHHACGKIARRADVYFVPSYSDLEDGGEEAGIVVIQHIYIGNYPDERQDDWASECQGVSHDANNWFITQKGSVWRVPIEKDLTDHLQDGVDGVRRRPIPLSGYDHFGDPDVHRGTLYVPLEGKRWIFPPRLGPAPSTHCRVPDE